MKKLISAVVLLVVLSAPAFEGPGPVPTCYPGTQCSNVPALDRRVFDAGGPVPTCYPGTVCGAAARM